MRVVVFGGSGLIGSRLVERLRAGGHEAVPASPSTGVDTLTGAGVAEVLAGADVAVDVTNSPSFEAGAVLDFFRTSSRTLLAAEREAGVRHHVALSVVGADRVPDGDYLRAKNAQEELIAGSGVPFTILRATQFFEFLGAIVALGTDGETVRLTGARLQPLAADDVVSALADVVTGSPAGGVVEVAGPEPLPLAELGRRWLANRGDDRKVITDPHARYFGAELADASLLPGPEARIGAVTLEEWLGTPAAFR